MFFNKAKKIGRNCALVITPFATSQMEDIKKSLPNRQFSETEAIRCRFCLMILNLVMAIWWINNLERNTNRARKIIDSMVETFNGAFERNSKPIRIGDFVTDPVEIALIDSAMGQVGVSKDTMSSFKSIISTIYNNRVVSYMNAFNEVLTELRREIGKPDFPQPAFFSQSAFSPVARLFVKHYTGDLWENHIDFATKLSSLLDTWNMTIYTIVKTLI
ncbi:MAG: hypothetical protein AB1488_02400 [Nitrospirota bacterium]